MKQEKKEFDFLREALVPACAMFCVIVFVFFLIAMSVGINVTETETEIVTTFDNMTEILDEDATAAPPDALPVETLLGVFLFCMTVVLSGQLFKLDQNRVLLRMVHFAITELSFLIFILLMTGYLSEAGAPAGMLSGAGVAVLYFILLGIKTLVGKVMTPKVKGSAAFKVAGFMAPVFAIFALLVFGFSIFNLISQVPVVVTEVVEEIWPRDDVVQTTYIRVATPLAPTVQNYFRYLVSGVIFMLGMAILKMQLNKVAKVLLNFVVLTAGYIGTWIVGMDYFSMFSAHTVPAVVVYLAVYIATLITVCIVLFVKREKREEEEDYESQFAPGRRRSTLSKGDEKDI